MPRPKKKEKKPKLSKQGKKEKKEAKVSFDLQGDYTSQLVDLCCDREPDNIQGIYDNDEHGLGVSKIVYSGLPNFDKILARRADTQTYGLPLNKILELYGKFDSGKTTFLQFICSLFVSLGGIAFFVDFEYKLDPVWNMKTALARGLKKEDMKRFLYVRPKYFEWFTAWLIKTMKTIIVARNAATKGLVELEAKKRRPDDYNQQKKKFKKVIDMPYVIVVDSIANIYTKSEVEEDEEDGAHVAELARAFGHKLKLIRRILGQSNTLIIFANQERSLIPMGGIRVRPGMMTTPGGNAVKSNSDGRISIARKSAVKRTRDKIERTYAADYRIRVTKDQMGAHPFQDTTLRLYYDGGFSSFYSVLEACASAGIIQKSGPRYSLREDLHCEESEIDEFLVEHPTVEGILHKAYQNWMGKQ